MKIIFTKVFLNKLDKQVSFIAEDKPIAAEKFRTDLILKIEKIPNQPHAYKKSPFFENENIRELIFKGYRIVFEVRNEDVISVFGFHKWEGTLNL